MAIDNHRQTSLALEFFGCCFGLVVNHIRARHD
jgi:hypothetical protein